MHHQSHLKQKTMKQKLAALQKFSELGIDLDLFYSISIADYSNIKLFTKFSIEFLVHLSKLNLGDLKFDQNHRTFDLIYTFEDIEFMIIISTTNI